jgi:hypothetical protein
MVKATVYVGVAVFCALHQDFWFWREARPLIFGMLPVGLFYHVAYMAATSLLLWGLVRWRWPYHLEHSYPKNEASSGE